MVKCKKCVYAKPFKGAPNVDNFKLEEENLEDLQNGEILCEAIFLSIDPYMRAFPSQYPLPVGSTFIGGQVAKIVGSKNASFPEGKYVFGQFGWRTCTKINAAKAEESGELYMLPDFEGLPLSLGLGALGMPGITAYFGLFELCKPKPGETVVVTAAAGAVGSLVGQLAKITGCRVIGLAGSDEKCSWLKNELGFDEVLNYKTVDIGEALKKAAPNGVDCYFDNVGGQTSSTIISQMNSFGRIAVCGSIASYNNDLSELPKEILCEAIFLSVDPYMRAYPSIYSLPVGSTFVGGQVAKIVRSKNASFPEGKYIFGKLGWRAWTKINAAKADESMELYLLPDFEGLPLSLGLGALGMPGITAYFGFFELCKPKAGETVVVTGAAGAVGSLVGQLAKITGCRVIGLAGSDEKCSWLKNELGFDEVLNYKTVDIGEALKKAAPNGVDCYFDNVGGQTSSTIISQMNWFGRIAVCGSISSYNNDLNELPKATILQPALIFKQLKMEGFLSRRWTKRRIECILAMKTLIKEGKLKYRETITTGFENMPEAFINMLEGKNIGKALVKV